jgi:hypothetical protein
MVMLRTKWVPGAAVALAAMLAAGVAAARPLSVEIWTDRGDDAVYQPGDNMQVKARSNDDSYLLVYTIDSEGGITVLYPFQRAPGMVEGGRTYRMPPENAGYDLKVEPQVGQGYIVALASRLPFTDLPWYLRPIDPQGEAMGYEEEGFDEYGRVVGDPTVAIERIRRRVLSQPGDVEDFATSYTTYYVGHEVRYPRYVCNDCHRPNHWAWWDGWDPYYSTCSVVDFRVNWGWCWGPCMWSGHVPYYYYTIRPDCPPRYYPYYQNHDRWSSWNGTQTWTTLWGGPLTRYKSDPPVGYIPPTKNGDFPRGTPPGYKPPGYLPTTFKTAGGGRMGLPVGRNSPSYGEKPALPGNTTWRRTAGSTPQRREVPEAGERRGGQSQGTPTYREPQRRDQPSGSSGDRPSERQSQPRNDPPKRKEAPRNDPPPAHVDPPQHRESQRSSPPPARQDSPRQDSSGSGAKHGGRGGR